MKSRNLPIVILAAFSFMFMSCFRSKTIPDGGNNTPLEINSISPLHGPGGSNVTISGTGFSPIPVNDTVWVNGKRATVVSSTSTSLVVTIPVKAGSGTIALSVGGKTATGPMLTYDTVYVVTTYVGGASGNADGNLQNAQFKFPTYLCTDLDGNLYISDNGNARIRKVSSGGVVSTLAGTTQGVRDGPIATAQFQGPMGICRDPKGNIYVVDMSAHLVRMISTSGIVSTIAGTTMGHKEGIGSVAKFQYPEGICSDFAGDLFVADAGNSIIRMIFWTGSVYNTSVVAGNPCQSGYADGVRNGALFNDPFGICTDGQTNFYVADTYGQTIRKVTAMGVVTTIAGQNMIEGHADGPAASASFYQPGGICIDANGNLYVADTYNHLIRKISPQGIVSTIAGSTEGFSDGIGTDAKFDTPFGICVDAQGAIYVGDSRNNKIRKIVRL